MIDQEGEASHRDHQKLHSEGIMISVVGCLKFHVDQVHCGIGAGNVDELRTEEKHKSSLLYNGSNGLGFLQHPKHPHVHKSKIFFLSFFISKFKYNKVHFWGYIVLLVM